MLNADALQVLKCWLFISQTLKYKSELYGIQCIDLKSIEQNSIATYNYILAIESECDLDSKFICSINDYTTFIKDRSTIYRNYIDNPCTDLIQDICNLQLNPINLGYPIICTNGPFAYLI